MCECECEREKREVKERSEKYYERLCEVIKYYVGESEEEEMLCEEVSINEVKEVGEMLRLKEVIRKGEKRRRDVKEYDIKSEEEYREYIFGGEGLRLNGYERYL